MERKYRAETGKAVTINKLKQTNAQNWYNSKILILDSLTLINSFFMSFILISSSSSLQINIKMQ